MGQEIDAQDGRMRGGATAHEHGIRAHDGIGARDDASHDAGGAGASAAARTMDAARGDAVAHDAPARGDAAAHDDGLADFFPVLGAHDGSADGRSAVLAAGYSAHDVERWAPEPPKDRHRSPFDRDRARLIHSSALRRLGAKTQILMAGTDDFSRTRLTHTLEVAQIGRGVAIRLGADPDLVECACLAHDLGHPPFGHNGEHELARIAAGIGGFEGNAQTLRLLTRLEPKVFFPGAGLAADTGPTGPASGMGASAIEGGRASVLAPAPAPARSAGVNLTRAALDASIKYPWTLDQADQHPKGERSKKFGVYPDDMEVFAWIRRGAPAWRTPVECQIMDLADDVAYSVHDVEDAIVSGAFEPAALRDPRIIDRIVEQARAWYGLTWNADGLRDAFGRLAEAHLLPERFDGSRMALAALKNITSALIGRFAESVEQATRAVHGDGPLTRYRGDVVVPEGTAYEIVALKGVAVHFVMAPGEHAPLHERQRKVIADLVDVMMARDPDPAEALEPVFRADWEQAGDDTARLRVAIDQVASLTDGSTMALHARLCG